MDHVFPRSLGGNDDCDNLAAACYRCNEFKGAKTSALDPKTQEFVALFNPRIEVWTEHFVWGNGGTHVMGLTPIGRATTIALRLNNENVVLARSIWIGFGWHPPTE